MNAKLTQGELQAIKDRADKATEGEWITDAHRVYNGKTNDELICELWTSFADAEFIANARQDIPKLVAEVEHLKTVLRAIGAYTYEEAIKQICREALK